MKTIWLITASANDGSSPGDVTLRYSTGGYVTKPGDTPSNTHFAPRILDPGSIVRTIFSGGTTFGSVEVGYGDILLNNEDGALDGLKDYGWGRTITIESITALRPAKAAYTAAITRFVGIVDHVEADFNTLRLVIRDNLAQLDIPLQTSVFDGTSTGATGIEGNANIEGQLKPMAFGRSIRNAAPFLVNYSKEAYGWNFGADGTTKSTVSVNALRNGGATYVLSGTDHADQATLFAATVTAANADTSVAESLLRTSGGVDLQITLDATIASSANSTMAQVASQMMAEHGFSISSASITALDAKNSAEVGIYIDGALSLLDAVQLILESGGCYLICDTEGTFTVGRFEAPSGTVKKAIKQWEILSEGEYQIELVPTDDENTGVPFWRVTASFDQNYTVQAPGDLKSSVSEDDRVKWGQDAFRVVVEDTAVLSKHPNAREIELKTYFVNESDASTEATRRLSFLGDEKLRLRVPLDSSRAVRDSDGTPVDIGDYVTLEMSRFGLSTAKDFVVIGVETIFSDNVTIVDIVRAAGW